mmetsp:Transcript_26634/g.70892  ORF Transcript_26634/g.70892 Transcript_26634/m.70892 type:complete len:221 (+) Transcript_26634:884-1546(+)
MTLLPGCRGLQPHLVNQLEAVGLARAVPLKVGVGRDTLLVTLVPVLRGGPPAVCAALPAPARAPGHDAPARGLELDQVLRLCLLLELLQVLPLDLAVLVSMRCCLMHLLAVLPLASHHKHDLQKLVHLLPLRMDLLRRGSVAGGAVPRHRHQRLDAGGIRPLGLAPQPRRARYLQQRCAECGQQQQHPRGAAGAEPGHLTAAFGHAGGGATGRAAWALVP